MIKIVSADEMREIDRKAIEDYGIPGVVLMENAGRGAADAVEEFASPKGIDSVLVIAGKGNNGGDGFVVARHLSNRGFRCEVLLAGKKEDVRGDARTNLDVLTKTTVDIREIGGDTSSIGEAATRTGLIVDALLGTGLNQEVKGFYRNIIDAVNSSGLPVISLDIPSGLDSTTGRPLGAAVEAEMTVTFCLPKTGAVVYPGADYVGDLVLVDIGAPRELLESDEIKTALITGEYMEDIFPSRRADTHKGTYGHLLVVAGSKGKTGAAVMAAQGAMRSGAGLVTVAAPSGINDILEVKLTEAMTEPLDDDGRGFPAGEASGRILNLLESRNVLVIGPGISREGEAGKMVKEVLAGLTVPAILDADALWHLAGFMDVLKDTAAPLILTPHPGEMGRLLGISAVEVQRDRIGIAREFAREYGCWLVLKGARSLVAAPDGRLFINTTGNPGMATAGTGDVLCGMIGAFVSQGLSPLDSCIAAVYLHGEAGDSAAGEKGEEGLIATDVIEKIPQVLKKFIS